MQLSTQEPGKQKLQTMNLLKVLAQKGLLSPIRCCLVLWCFPSSATEQLTHSFLCMYQAWLCYLGQVFDFSLEAWSQLNVLRLNPSTSDMKVLLIQKTGRRHIIEEQISPVFPALCCRVHCHVGVGGRAGKELVSLSSCF